VESEIRIITQEKILDPGNLLKPLAQVFPKEVSETIKHENNHALADPERNTLGGEFGYSAMLVTLPNGLIIASWIAWYKPWGEREPDEMMQIAQGPGFLNMSEQDSFIYNQAKKEWVSRLKEKQKEENPISILEIIPSKENEEEEEYKKRAQIILRFAEKLEEFSRKGILPPIDELTNEEFANLDKRYRNDFIKAYNEALKEIENSNLSSQNLKDKSGDNSSYVVIDKPEGTIFQKPQFDDYSELPLAV